MKELRESHKTKTIYPVNPYVEVYRFRDNLYGWFTHNLDGGGDVWMFLVVGPERALLIDTAYGLGDLPGLAAEITGGKPLLVANTHEHSDHAYGNCRFAKVYGHEYLVPYLETQNEHIWDYLFDEYGDNIWVEFDRADLPTFRKYEIVGVKDGYTFDLGGGHEVELVYQGGHSAGHAAYIDIDQLDYLFPGHFMVNLENNVLVDILQTLTAIIAEPTRYNYKDEQVDAHGTRRVRVDHESFPPGRYTPTVATRLGELHSTPEDDEESTIDLSRGWSAPSGTAANS
jgi:glyoxylase-like metal-dependent hydrolase (beta-lactamase superfamily II)